MFEVMVVDKVLRMSKLVVLMVKAVNMVVRVMLTPGKVTMIMVIMIGDGQGERVGGTERGRPCTSSAVPPALQIMNNANTNFTSSSSFFSSFSSFFSSPSSLSFSTSSWLSSISFFAMFPIARRMEYAQIQIPPFSVIAPQKIFLKSVEDLSVCFLYSSKREI